MSAVRRRDYNNRLVHDPAATTKKWIEDHHRSEARNKENERYLRVLSGQKNQDLEFKFAVGILTIKIISGIAAGMTGYFSGARKALLVYQLSLLGLGTGSGIIALWRNYR